MLIGRVHEHELLERKYQSDKSEFVALYGRRRVGKTFLVRSVFKQRFTFQLTGLSGANLKTQLQNFNYAVQEQHPLIKLESLSSWMEAFQVLKKIIEKSRQKKKVIFMDELPWLDTQNSGFIQALEHFWNSWASARKDVLLVVCGSAASWMIHKLINNKGGLHNRITLRIRVEPFTLRECAAFMKYKKIQLDHYQLIQLYMVLGGIPFYWDEVQKGMSAAQNINRLCFMPEGLLSNEFSNLFKSLFNRAERHETIVEALAKKSMGLSREELIVHTGIANGGNFTRLLQELEESGFIRKYIPFGKKNRDSLFQLCDFYSLFYMKFLQLHKRTTERDWMKMIDNPAYRAWSGYAFEQICLMHSKEIKKALGISGVETSEFSWRSSLYSNGAQIDLLIDRRDGVINLCEMKFAMHPFTIDKKYAAELRNKLGVFKQETNTRKALFLTMITTFGTKKNIYSDDIQNELDMRIFFR